MTKKSEPGKPALFANYTADDNPTFDPTGYEVEDASWIPGYSEIVRANEIAKADDFVWAVQHEKTGITKKQIYEVIGAQPQELPVEFAWLRVMGLDGGNSANADRERASYTKRGWRIVTVDDLKNWGLGLPPQAHVSGGMIRRDDVALFVVDGRRERSFREWEARQLAEAEAETKREGEKTGVPLTGEVERGTFTLNTKD